MRARVILRVVAALAIVAMLFSANLGAAEAQARSSPVIGSVEGLVPGDILFMRNCAAGLVLGGARPNGLLRQEQAS